MATDPDAALEKIAELQPLRSHSGRRSLLYRAMRALAEHDPDRALEIARAQDDPAVRKSAMEGVLAKLSESNPERAVQEMTSNGGSPRNAYANLANEDPSRAASLAKKLRDWNSLTQVLTGWADTDPAAALEWVRQHPDSENVEALFRVVVPRLAQTDPAQAMEHIAEISNQSLRTRMLVDAVPRWFMNDADSAVAFLDANLRGRQRISAIAGLVRTIHEKRPAYTPQELQQMRPLVDELPQPRYNDDAAHFAQAWAATDPKGAAEWSLAQPSATQHEATDSVISVWSQSDPAEAHGCKNTSQSCKTICNAGSHDWRRS
jgi:hypothetical protein